MYSIIPKPHTDYDVVTIPQGYKGYFESKADLFNLSLSEFLRRSVTLYLMRLENGVIYKDLVLWHPTAKEVLDPSFTIEFKRSDLFDQQKERLKAFGWSIGDACTVAMLYYYAEKMRDEFIKQRG